MNTRQDVARRKPQFEILLWDLARVTELFDYQQRKLHAADWGIKGHNRPWVIAQGCWQAGLRFLDVGAGFSDLPSYLARTYAAEAWVADDFGASAGEGIWSRWGDPSELPAKYPEVRYIFKNLGSQVGEIPEGFFDRVYSVSVLEHVDSDQIAAVLAHMAALLKPGGLLLNAVDIPFPRTIDRPGVGRAAGFLTRVAGRRFLTAIRTTGHTPYTRSIEGWARLLASVFDIHGALRGISTLQMVLSHDVLAEPPEVVYRFYPPNDSPKPYWRIASLLFILRKLA